MKEIDLMARPMDEVFILIVMGVNMSVRGKMIINMVKVLKIDLMDLNMKDNTFNGFGIF